jgi:hypothetical protein
MAAWLRCRPPSSIACRSRHGTSCRDDCHVSRILCNSHSGAAAPASSPHGACHHEEEEQKCPWTPQVSTPTASPAPHPAYGLHGPATRPPSATAPTQLANRRALDLPSPATHPPRRHSSPAAGPRGPDLARPHLQQPAEPPRQQQPPRRHATAAASAANRAAAPPPTAPPVARGPRAGEKTPRRRLPGARTALPAPLRRRHSGGGSGRG